MNRLLIPILLIISSIVLLIPNYAYAAPNERLNSLIKECGIVFEDIAKMPDNGIPQNLIKDATGIAIFPSTIKGAFFLGARYGEGVVLHRDPKTRIWGPPAFFTVSGISYGLQFGGQAIDLVFVIPTERGFEGMLENQINVGTNSALVAGPVGRNAELGADITLKGGIFTYSRSKGLFAGIALKGIAISPNNEANKAYYGSVLSARDILIDGKAKPTKEAEELIRIISTSAK